MVPYFYPRSPCGERQAHPAACPMRQGFLSTLSLRRATDLIAKELALAAISIHALLAESDRRTGSSWAAWFPFLSTLSLRRATRDSRSVSRWHAISIHALLAESDGILGRRVRYRQQFLSTLSLRRATRLCCLGHVLLLFLSTLSLRRATSFYVQSSLHNSNFYPRSPCGERREWRTYQAGERKFLSTLSLRRATCGHCGRVCAAVISIHALLAESDSKLAKTSRTENISIHALLAESD